MHYLDMLSKVKAQRSKLCPHLFAFRLILDSLNDSVVFIADKDVYIKDKLIIHGSTIPINATDEQLETQFLKDWKKLIGWPSEDGEYTLTEPDTSDFKIRFSVSKDAFIILPASIMFDARCMDSTQRII